MSAAASQQDQPNRLSTAVLRAETFLQTSAMHATGIVISGRNKGAARVSSVADRLAPLLGAPPVPGTMNVVMALPLELDPKEAVLVVEGERLFWPIELNGLPCLAYRWRGAPLHIVEVISSRRLRDEFGLVDGSRVEIEAPHARRVSPTVFLAWAILWAFRQRLYYTSERYAAWTKRLSGLRWRSGQKARA